MKKVFFVLFFLFFTQELGSFLLFPSSVFAVIGVGIGTGKIQIEDKLKPGIIYELPSLTVLNTGDEPSDYEVNVSYHEKQPQLRPPQNWFIFFPQKFYLEPSKAQTVKIKLNLPVKTEPGDYFAYLEGHPVKKSLSGNTTIGVAAASKLYFTVIPGSFLEGIYYKIASFWKIYAPLPQRVLLIIGVLLVLGLFKKFFNIQINLKKQPLQPPTGSRRLRRLEQIKTKNQQNTKDE